MKIVKHIEEMEEKMSQSIVSFVIPCVCKNITLDGCTVQGRHSDPAEKGTQRIEGWPYCLKILTLLMLDHDMTEYMWTSGFQEIIVEENIQDCSSPQSNAQLKASCTVFTCVRYYTVSIE